MDNKNKDENGRIIESFISTDINIIKDLKTNLIYGELLNYKYYIKKNFDELLLKMNEIKTNKFPKYNERDIKISFCNNKSW